MQEYEQFDAKADESITDIYDRFLTLLNDLSLVGKEYDREDSNTKFLRALPKEWDTQASIIRHQYDLDLLTLDKVYGILKTHDLEIQQRKNMKDTYESSDLDTDTDEDSEIKLDDPQVVQMASMLMKGFRRMRFVKSQRKCCYNKKYFGDGKGKFRKNEGEYSKERKIDKAKALFTSNSKKDWMDSSGIDNDEECYELMERMCQELIRTNPDGLNPDGAIPDGSNPDGSFPDRKSSVGNKKNVLVLDIGCSAHMIGNKSLMLEYEEKVCRMVSYGDGNVGKTLGYGNIIIGNVIISNVALVEGLKHNLLSISQIADRGFYVVFYDTHCEVVHKVTKKVVFKGYRHGNIYEAKLHSNTDGPQTCLIRKASVYKS
ncbi:hypothetical protein AgCh_009170 [Apium graveolens]